MARITNLGDETDIKWIFNVSFQVGPAGYNRRDDVLLVQHTLNKLITHFDLFGQDGKPINAYLRRDGWFGPKTQNAIWGYQNNLKTVRKRQVGVDGSVDPSSHSGWSNKTNMQYTIVYMNRDHLQIYGSMMQDDEFPIEVQAALKANGTS